MKLDFHAESWPLASPFIISRGSRTKADVVVVSLEHEGIRGRGECTPYARYGESVPQTLGELEAAATRLERGGEIGTLLRELPPGAARNALDCACWDWKCKKAGKRIVDLLTMPPLREVISAYTIGVQSPRAVEEAARKNAHRPLLKIKTGGEDVVASVEAARRGAPESRLIVDANEAWPGDRIVGLLEAMAKLDVAFVEQPLPAGKDDVLAGIRRPLPVIADESVHTSGQVADLASRYDGVNIKLDKAGGLTEALELLKTARAHHLIVMCGCMLGTSLAMAPAMVLAQHADYVDLDAPLLLARDRPEGIRFCHSSLLPFSPILWG